MRNKRLASRASSSFATGLEEVVHSFSASGKVLFMFLSGLLIVSVIGLLYLLNASLLVATPAHGGTWSEGIVGAPRFINPVLAVSDADEDLTSLVYSGLLKATPEGTYVPDLAQSYSVSPDGKTYTFVLRKNAVFQDGTPVTADDIVFTINKIEDTTLQSPQYANWSGVEVTKVDDHTVSFTLPQPYAPFIENFTVGILPQHLWQNIADNEFAFDKLNSDPVGSGPFKVSHISKTAAGVPSEYLLEPFSQYALGVPYLSTIDFRFYQNEDDLINALNQGEVSAASGISPESLSELPGFTVAHAPLNRVFGVFFNQNQSAVLRDPTVRKALSEAIDRTELVKEVLGGYGTPLSGPLPPSLVPLSTTSASSSSEDLALASSTLAAAGWKRGPDGILEKSLGSGKNAQTETLSFSLSTGNVPELRAAAEYLRKTWGALGASVTVNVYDQGDLSQNVIRARKYDALLFGEVIGRVPDLYAFWDTSERLDPGLNIAMYANPDVDKLVEELRTTQDASTRESIYQSLSQDIAADNPAVFLYAPDFVYIVPKDIKGLDLGYIETPSDRFLNVTNWHTKTEYVWPIFSHH